MDNENITYKDKTIILEEAKIICGSDIENEINCYRTEFFTYNIDELFCNAEAFTSHKEIFKILSPYIIRHITKPLYRNKNYIFIFSLEEKTDDSIKISHIEIKLSWQRDHIRLKPLSESLTNEIENMDENIFSDTRDDIKLVIIAQEVATLGNSVEQPEQKINKNKTFKNEECVVCLLNPSNILFCSCGHICICSKCLSNNIKNR